MAARRIDVQEIDPRDPSGRWRKALEHLDMMKSALLARSFNTAAHLGIQAVIAACDAFTISHLGKQCSSDRHEDAIEVFRRVRTIRGVDDAIHHMERVLKAKRWIDYSGQYPRPDESERTCQHAERFVEFVGRNLNADR